MEPDFLEVETNGVMLNVAVAGDGPLILLVHGFPESWYSWRHQIAALAQAGYRAAAPDVRGYGRSAKPEAIGAYTLESLAGDMAGLAQALSPGEKAVIVGHDWGAPIAWTSALAHPDRFRAVAGLSIPHIPPGKRHMLDAMRERFVEKGRFFYLHYFQQPGVAEAEFEADVRAALWGMLYAWSGEAPDGYWHNQRPADASMFQGIDPRPPVTALPAWLSQADLDYYVAEFEASGFRGPLNRYRTFDEDFAFLNALPTNIIQQPALFIGGRRDPALAMFPQDVAGAIAPGFADLRGVHMLEGVGHWIQQEAPDEVNALLIDWLGEVSPR